jgi:dTDP-4-dehydrorhamnose 3,5-epimerase
MNGGGNHLRRKRKSCMNRKAISRELRFKGFNQNTEPFIEKTPIEDLLVIKRPKYEDARGAFEELYRRSHLENTLGRKIELGQEQVSWSRDNVLRGIHFEPQDKIITPETGEMTAVFVDMRTNSSTFGSWLKMEFINPLDFKDLKEIRELSTIFIPEGVGNSLCVTKGVVIYKYTVTKEYDKNTAGMGIRYDDPDLAIDWPVKNPIVSERDQSLPSLKEFLKLYR